MCWVQAQCATDLGDDSGSQTARLPKELGEAPPQLQQSRSNAFKPKHEAGRLSMPSIDDTSSADHVSRSPQAEIAHAEPSEEELLQWQPVIPAKKQPAECAASGKQGGRANFPTKKPAGTALPADTAPARIRPPDAAESVSSSSNLLRTASSGPATSTFATGSVPAESFPSSSSLLGPASSFPAASMSTTNSTPATTTTFSEAAGVATVLPRAVGTAVPHGKLMGSTAVKADKLQTLQTLAASAMSMSVHQISSSASLPASSAVVAGPLDLTLRTTSSVSSLGHTLHAGHAVLPPQLALSLPPVQAASHSFPLPALSPAAAAAALTASTDSDWPTVHAPEHRHNTSSWLSQASDTPTLRHSIASISSVQCTDSSSVPEAEHPVTAVTNSDAMVASPQLPVQWHLLDTKELQAQTAALLSSLTASTDWDCATTDAPQHREMAPAAQQNQSETDPQLHNLPGSCALSQSIDLELQSATLATAQLARPEAKVTGGRNVVELTAPSSCSLTASSSISCGSDSTRRVSGGQSPGRRASGGQSPASSLQLPPERLSSGVCSFPLHAIHICPVKLLQLLSYRQDRSWSRQVVRAPLRLK